MARPAQPGRIGDLGFKLLFPNELVTPTDVHYEPWKYFAKREKPDIVVHVMGHTPSGEKIIQASFPVHKRIIEQSYVIASQLKRRFFVAGSEETLEFQNQDLDIFRPIIAYMYMHDFQYLAATNAQNTKISRAVDMLTTLRSEGSFHVKRFHSRMLYHIKLHRMAHRLGLNDLCELIVERFIKIHDVPGPHVEEHNSQNPDYKYCPFKLWNMDDACKYEYLKLVYHPSIDSMRVGARGNLRWRVAEGVTGRTEIAEAFDSQFEDFPGFFDDVMVALRLACGEVDSCVLQDHQLYKQYVGLLNWSKGIEDRRARKIAKKNAQAMEKSMTKLSFHEADKENQLAAGTSHAQTVEDEASSKEEL